VTALRGVGSGTMLIVGVGNTTLGGVATFSISELKLQSTTSEVYHLFLLGGGRTLSMFLKITLEDGR
jgi:hypothetical protein